MEEEIEFQDKPEDIAIHDVKQYLVAKKKVKDERKNFKEVIAIFGYVSDYLKDCVAAYNVIQKRSEREGFPMSEFQRLESLVYKCRLLLNSIEEEYRIYEESVNVAKVAPNPSVQQRGSCGKISVFQRLSGSTRRVFKLADGLAKELDEEKNLEQTIASNLHKILPKKSGSKPATAILNLVNKKIVEKSQKDSLQELNDNMHLLENCIHSPNVTLRGDAMIMLREIRGELKVFSDPECD